MKFLPHSKNDLNIHLKLSDSLFDSWNNTDSANQLYLHSRLNQAQFASMNASGPSGRMNFIDAFVTLFSQPP
jgi:hypothetical protein